MKLRNISQVIGSGLATISLFCALPALATEPGPAPGWVYVPLQSDSLIPDAVCGVQTLDSHLTNSCSWRGNSEYPKPNSEIWIVENILSWSICQIQFDVRKFGCEADNSIAQRYYAVSGPPGGSSVIDKEVQCHGRRIQHLVIDPDAPPIIDMWVDTHSMSFIDCDPQPFSGYGHMNEYYEYKVQVQNEPPSTLQTSFIPPPWWSPPTDPVSPSHDPSKGGTQDGGDPVDLATGNHLYLHSPDISVYNPRGPAACYQRNYISSRAKNVNGNNGYGSPGLSKGWVDNFDVCVDIVDSNKLKIVYPNGAVDELAVDYGESGPNGQFTEPQGAPYEVTGIYANNQWTAITITWKQGPTKWSFIPKETGKLRLCSIINKMGRRINISRDPLKSYRVDSVTDDSNVFGMQSNNVLLSFQYNEDNLLTSVTDVPGNRKVTYTFVDGNLSVVSQIADANTATPERHWTYGYETVLGQPHLHTVSVPNPTGATEDSTQTFNHDLQGRVSSVVDANNNQRCYTYEYQHYVDQTKVEVKNSSGTVEKWWVQHFDLENMNANTGISDAEGHRTYLMYNTDSTQCPCPYKPSLIMDANGKRALIEYDGFGNVTKITNPRKTTTVYTYEYPINCPTGRLTGVQEGSKTATVIHYNDAGLIDQITYPAPDGTTRTVFFEYDDLGNVLTVKAPGNSIIDTTTNELRMITTTYDYGTNPKLGQPLTVTVSDSQKQPGDPTSVTHITYDDRGNIETVTDALGRTTNFEYNIADQITKAILPAVPAQ